MDYVIHPLTPADEPILWEMLYQALRTSQEAPPRDIVRQPEYARHVEGWGRAGDTGFVAYDAEKKDELLGAAWFRLPPAESEHTAYIRALHGKGLPRSLPADSPFGGGASLPAGASPGRSPVPGEER